MMAEESKHALKSHGPLLDHLCTRNDGLNQPELVGILRTVQTLNIWVNSDCRDDVFECLSQLMRLLERPCASQEGGSMLLKREGGFLRRGGGFLRRGGGS